MSYQPTIGNVPMNVEIIWGDKFGERYRSVVHGLAHCMSLNSRFRLRCEVLMNSSGWFNIVGNNVTCIPEDESLCLYFGNWSFLSPMLLFKLCRDNGNVEIYFSPPDKECGKQWELWFVGDICSPEFDLDNIIRRFDEKLLKWRFWSLDVLTLLFMVVSYIVFGCYCFVMDMEWQCGVFCFMGISMGVVCFRLFGLRRLWYEI